MSIKFMNTFYSKTFHVKCTCTFIHRSYFLFKDVSREIYMYFYSQIILSIQRRFTWNLHVLLFTDHTFYSKTFRIKFTCTFIHRSSSYNGVHFSDFEIVFLYKLRYHRYWFLLSFFPQWNFDARNHRSVRTIG